MKPSEILITIPHASTHIPDAIRPLIPHSDHTLNHEPDLFTDELCHVPGIDTVHAKVSRIISDVNRAPDEIYTSGRERYKGVVMLMLSNMKNTFEEDPPLEQMQEWINRYHAPFHQEVDELCTKQKKTFLIDCHSMWSDEPLAPAGSNTRRPDICIGNRQYTICDAQTTLWMKEFWKSQGYNVLINNPFAGRYVTGIHCSVKGMSGIQIEFNRSLYLDEVSLKRNDDAIARINGQFREFLEKFCTWDDQRPRNEKMHMCDLSKGYAGLGQ